MMKSLSDSFQLRNGVRIPCVGFGTWKATDGKMAVDAVKKAIELGYRHIDTAADYGNEASVGIAVKECNVPRADLFITSKLQNNEHGYEATMVAFENTMDKLGMDYLDLYLIHWPNPIKFRSFWKEANAGTWKAFEELYEIGRIRSIGISNFLPHHMDALLETAKIIPMVNQFHFCPGETHPEIMEYTRKYQILLEAYSPLGSGRVFEVPEVKVIAAKYGKTVAQVCLRWSLQMGYLPLPKSVTPSRIQENTEIFDFEITAEDVSTIANMTDCCGHVTNPDEITF